jgi:putative FmdB family regulatory protein
MPTYEYRCSACGHEFVEVHTIGEHGGAKVSCPKCKSKKVERRYSSFFAKTSKKS